MRPGLATSRTPGNRRLTRSAMAGVSEPSATITSTDPGQSWARTASRASAMVASAFRAGMTTETAGASAAAAVRRDGPAPETPLGRERLPSIRPVTPRAPESGSPRRAPACVGAVAMMLHR